MKARSAKTKGSRLEREFAALLRGYDLDKDAKRMPLSGAFGDSRFKADIITTLPIHFEIKNHETWKPLEFFRQAESVCGARTPVVIMSRNNEQMYSFLLTSDFLTILKAAILGGYVGPVALPKPIKQKKSSLEESEGLMFSKSKQLGIKKTN